MSVEVAIGALRSELEQLQARAEQIARAVTLLQPLAPSEQIADGALAAIIPSPRYAAIRLPGTTPRVGDLPEAAFSRPSTAPADPPEAPPDPPRPAQTPPAPRREPSTGKGRDGLTPSAQTVLSIINALGTASVAQIRAHQDGEDLGVSTVKKACGLLLDRELITASGQTKSRRYHSVNDRKTERPQPKVKPGAAQAAVEDAGVLRCKILDLVRRDPGLTEQQIRLALPPTHAPDAVTAALVKLRGEGKLTLSMGAYRLSAAERGVKGGVGTGVLG